jgi:hypothetical protein
VRQQHDGVVGKCVGLSDGAMLRSWILTNDSSTLLRLRITNRGDCDEWTLTGTSKMQDARCGFRGDALICGVRNYEGRQEMLEEGKRMKVVGCLGCFKKCHSSRWSRHSLSTASYGLHSHPQHQNTKRDNRAVWAFNQKKHLLIRHSVKVASSRLV